MRDGPRTRARPGTVAPRAPGSGPLLSSDERAAAFAAGAPKVPRKTIVAVLSACLVLGLGGVVVDHFFSGADASTVTPHLRASKPSHRVASPKPADLTAPVSAMMGLRALT